ncbi:hypothetical protein [Mesobacillus harenae]|uniref:hypothetical protein n=1 Tax=Mesobacillus harenae TaxID=2213203 RepID=UPI00157FF34A|nr:hypothetical protein [Mesobacillus harenae]
MNSSNSICIKEIVPNSKSVVINFSAGPELKRFFHQQSFFAEYDINIEAVPKSILVIPFLTNILPVAWANGIDIYVDELDCEFNEAVIDLKMAFKGLYPKLIKSNSNIIANRIVENKKWTGERTAQLFSGGLDSLATLVRKIDERPFLITICGADVSLNDRESWEIVQDYSKKIAEDTNTDVLFIKSNFKDFLNHSELEVKFGSIVNGWWTGVQHGLGLCGLSAPLTFAKEINAFYIASSHTSNYKLPYGSHPSTDNKLRWGSTRIIHEAYELTRQQKVRVIANYIKSDYSSLQIRVCWRAGSNGGNCSQCEKCSRTIVGLLLEGIDPNGHGFRIDSHFPMHVRSQFESNAWKLDEAVAFQWKDIQARIPENTNTINEQYLELFNWIQTYNFKDYQPGILLKAGGTVAKILPAKQKKFIKSLIGME